MGDPLKKHHANVMRQANADMLRQAVVYKPGFEPKEQEAIAPLPQREGDPAFLRRSVDALEWDEFSRCVPGGEKYKQAVENIADRICDPERNVAEVAMLADSLTSLTREIVRGILAVKAKQAEKPVQMNTQVNVDTSAFPLTRSLERKTLRGNRKTVPATIDSSAQDQPSQSEDQTSTSHQG